MPKCRQVRATLRGASPARCNILTRQLHNRVCSIFVIASPCRKSRPTKTPLTLPSLWTPRTRPQGTWKLQSSFHSANSAHPLFEEPKQKRARSVNLVLGLHKSEVGRLRLEVRLDLDPISWTRVKDHWCSAIDPCAAPQNWGPARWPCCSKRRGCDGPSVDYAAARRCSNAAGL